MTNHASLGDKLLLGTPRDINFEQFNYMDEHMTVEIVGTPNFGNEDIPTFNLEDDGPPGGGGLPEDTMPNGEDWFGRLMNEAGFTDNQYFASWNEATKTSLIENARQWTSEGNGVRTIGLDFDMPFSEGYTFNVQSTWAEAANGWETWITKWMFQGINYGSVVMFQETNTTARVISTDHNGVVKSNVLLQNMRLEDGLLVWDEVHH